jgi:hypothetical protein
MESAFHKNKNTAYRILDGEALVVNFSNSSFYVLNPVGTFIWDRCDGQQTMAKIAAALAEKYEVTPEEAITDCRQFIEELLEEGLLCSGLPHEVQDAAPRLGS